MTLIELMTAISILVISLVGFARVIASSIASSRTNHQATMAREAGRQIIEELWAADFQDVFAIYNADPEDDPGGIGTGEGSGVPVPGLDLVEGDVDGFAGEILFPTIGGAKGLREDVVNRSFGTPRDLNGDGLVDDQDHADDYRLLPVIVRFEWRSKTGPAYLELKTLLANF